MINVFLLTHLLFIKKNPNKQTPNPSDSFFKFKLAGLPLDIIPHQIRFAWASLNGVAWSSSYIEDNSEGLLPMP